MAAARSVQEAPLRVAPSRLVIPLPAREAESTRVLSSSRDARARLIRERACRGCRIAAWDKFRSRTPERRAGEAWRIRGRSGPANVHSQDLLRCRTSRADTATTNKRLQVLRRAR